MTHTWWMILLALYLIIVAVLGLTNIEIVAVNILQACLAAGAAICLLIGK